MPLEIKSVSDCYAVIEMYEMGAVDKTTYLKSAAFLLKHFETKYGKDDFRFRELFAHMQGDDWESTFEVRVLAHCENIGCYHKTLEECAKYMDGIEAEIFKGKRCQHCRLLEGREEKWKGK